VVDVTDDDDVDGGKRVVKEVLIDLQLEVFELLLDELEL